MEQPKFVFRQGDHLKGMTSSLRNGACWGLTVKWLEDCYSGGPSVAGLGIAHGTTPHVAMANHFEHANQFLSGVSDDVNIASGISMLSGLRLDGARDTSADVGAGAGPTTLSLVKAIGITMALTNHAGNYFGMVVFKCPIGRHAMAVAKCRNVWSLFDPNHGTWTYAGDTHGAPPQFSTLLKDNFDSYRVSDVKLLQVTRL